jgi:hypothetical protein
MSTSTVHFRDLLHAANLRHGTHGFTSLPKEGVLKIFPPLKIRWLRPGLNRLTPRPPKPLYLSTYIHTHITLEGLRIAGRTYVCVCVFYLTTLSIPEIIQRRWSKNEWEWRTGGLTMTGENWITRKDPFSFSTFTPKIPLVLVCDWTRTPAVKGRRNDWQQEARI